MDLLTVQDLKKSYQAPDGEERLVVHMDQFSLQSGTQLGLCGGSGTGKTTFLHLIAGIVAADSGKIHVCGAELSSLKEADRDSLRAREIGYIFQTFNLLQGFTCLENVLLGMTFGAGADRRFAESLLERVGLGERLHYYPRQLSTGQQQRVAVARALANRPKLVLADEPTGNLDGRNAREVLSLILESCRENDAALLLVSHDQKALDSMPEVADLAAINKAGTAVEGREA